MIRTKGEREELNESDCIYFIMVLTLKQHKQYYKTLNNSQQKSNVYITIVIINILVPY